MARIITFGEIMLRLNPESYLRLVQADKYEATVAGGEAFLYDPRIVLKSRRPWFMGYYSDGGYYFLLMNIRGLVN